MNDRWLPHTLMLIVVLGTYILASRRLRRPIKAFSIQSFALALVACQLAGRSEHPHHLWILAGLTAAVKGVAVPLALLGAVRRLGIRRDIEFIVNIPSSLVLAAVGALGAFALGGRLAVGQAGVPGGALGAGLATILLGLIVMMGRKKLVTQIVGLLVMENGVILCALGLTLGMPLIVEIGVALDVLVAVQILALFAYRISNGLSGLHEESAA